MVDQLVTEQGRAERFVTGVVSRLDLRTGLLRYVNAGHPSPLLMRRGKVVKELDGGRRVLFGFSHGDAPAAVAEEKLEPGDSVVLYTDGITEARDAAGAFFGLDRLIGRLERSAAGGLRAPETLRRLTPAVLDHQGGLLQDDATLVLVQWSSGSEHGYTSGSTSAPSPLGDPTAPRH